MKNKIKKWHIALMSFLTLFIAVFASLFSLRADTVDEETGEVLTDNWELGVVFYDSTVDNGKTPLTEINWDASDGGYKEGTPRTITVQINYKNNSAVTTYQPGELEISIPNLIYKNSAGTAIDAQWNTSVIVSANDANHSGYDWNFKPYTYSLNGFGYSTSVPNEYGKVYKFTNANTIEEKTNFEGSIQIQYTITPGSETPETVDTCTHSYETNIKATLNNISESNEILFKYIRIYTHPWEYLTYTIKKTASKISSLDGLPHGDYYWVKYNFELTAFTPNGNKKYGSYSVYPHIGSRNQEIRDVFPENCIVLNSSLTELSNENNQYSIPITSWNEYSTNKFIYVGYPKSIYNDDNNNLNITNHAKLYTKYENSGEFIYMDESDVSINLADFEFIYSGNLYGINKLYKHNSSPYSNEKTYYESLTGQDPSIGNKGTTYAQLNPTAMYTGELMDVKFGDDLLYITNSEGNYRKLEDSEYYFSTIKFPAKLKNGNSQDIPEGKYNCELWIRYANNINYIKYEDFTNINQEYSYGKTWNFTKEDSIVGYYFVIKNMSESLYPYFYSSDSGYSSIRINNASNIAESGYIYNFGFIQVFIDGILQNQPTIDSYANFITQEEIATFDQNTYGSYMQRSYDFISYKKFELETPTYYIKPYKSIGKLTQDVENEIFSGKASISVRNYSRGDKFGSDQEIKNYTYQLSDKNKVQGFEFFDLLPLGMELVSTPDEIKNSISTSGT